MTDSQRKPQIIVLAKAPTPGRVKTRLHTRYTPQQAADLAKAALEDTLNAASMTGAPVHLVVEGDLADLPRVPEGTTIHPQREGGLAERIHGAFEDAGGGVLVGMDTPQVTSDLLQAALDAYAKGRTPFGLASDGGWWLLGLGPDEASLVDGVPTSVPTTGAEQLARLEDRDVEILTTLQDVDTPLEAAQVASEAPLTLFAQTHDHLAVTP